MDINPLQPVSDRQPTKPLDAKIVQFVPANDAARQPETKSKPHRPNYAQLHRRPLPLEVYPLPAIIPHNPLSLVRVIYTIFCQYWFPPSSHPAPEQIHKAYYCAMTRAVHVTDPRSIRALWECGFFGKGSLSRSEPEWLAREMRRMQLANSSVAMTSADVTNQRRLERREAKKERARLEREVIEEQLRKEGKVNVIEVAADEHVNGTAHVIKDLGTDVHRDDSVKGEEDNVSILNGNPHGIRILSTASPPPKQEPASATDQEHLQLAPVEAFFLVYGLGVVEICDPVTNTTLSSAALLDLFRRTSYFPPLSELEVLQPDDSFILSYVVYHHFRSLGWVVRPGMKFAADFLLYNRGPVFAHAEFAVLILPDYGHEWWSATTARKEQTAEKQSKTWWWLHCASRVQTQVRKSLILVYVEVPPPPVESESRNEEVDIGSVLRRYRIREFSLKRWSANRSRD